MPRVRLRYNPRKVFPRDLAETILPRLREVIARTVSTEMGPVIAEECTLRVEPFGDSDQPMHDLELVVKAHNFEDRRGQNDLYAKAIKAHLTTASGSRAWTISVWVDLIDMGYAEFPDRTT